MNNTVKENYLMAFALTINTAQVVRVERVNDDGSLTVLIWACQDNEINISKDGLIETPRGVEVEITLSDSANLFTAEEYLALVSKQLETIRGKHSKILRQLTKWTE